ncbi:MAG: hypothetical protein OEV40_29115 [Acidimicrobiia bacterium]|nr:hypothetical protein [Acidimicrobiia bacterium]
MRTVWTGVLGGFGGVFVVMLLIGLAFGLDFYIALIVAGFLGIVVGASLGLLIGGSTAAEHQE